MYKDLLVQTDGVIRKYLYSVDNLCYQIPLRDRFTWKRHTFPAPSNFPERFTPRVISHKL